MRWLDEADDDGWDIPRLDKWNVTALVQITAAMFLERTLVVRWTVKDDVLTFPSSRISAARYSKTTAR
jgi:hypothetical protein